MLDSSTVFIIPTDQNRNEMCDYRDQSAKALSKDYPVIIFEINRNNPFNQTSVFSNVEKSNVFYYSAYFTFPFFRPKWLQKLNTFFHFKLLVFFLHCYYKKIVVWCSYPSYEYLIENDKNYTIIFDIIDFYQVKKRKANSLLLKQKKSLLKKADIITAISLSLKKTNQRLTQKNIYIVPQGFNENGFSKKGGKIPVPNLEKRLITIGFIGHLNDRLDFNLLHTLITRNKKWNFIFIGPKDFDETFSQKKDFSRLEDLFKHKNVTWLDRQPKSTISSLIDQFDVCMIPYDVRFDFNRYCYPMKLFEYFYMGKPVIATPIEELSRFPQLVKIGSTAAEWEVHIKSLLSRPWPTAYKKQQKKLAEENSWERKVSQILDILEKHEKNTKI